MSDWTLASEARSSSEKRFAGRLPTPGSSVVLFVLTLSYSLFAKIV